MAICLLIQRWWKEMIAGIVSVQHSSDWIQVVSLFLAAIVGRRTAPEKAVRKFEEHAKAILRTLTTIRCGWIDMNAKVAKHRNAAMGNHLPRKRRSTVSSRFGL